jgi:hypothetical protein
MVIIYILSQPFCINIILLPAPHQKPSKPYLNLNIILIFQNI